MSVSNEKIARLRADMLGVPLSPTQLAGCKNATRLTSLGGLTCYCGAGALLKASGVDDQDIARADMSDYTETARGLKKFEQLIFKTYSVWLSDTVWKRAMLAFDHGAMNAFWANPTEGVSNQWPSRRELTQVEAEAAVDSFLNVVAQEAEEVVL